MSVQLHATKPTSHVDGCAGFWLWALVGGGVAFGFISFLGPVVLLPSVLFAFLLVRWSAWRSGPVLLGLITGAGLPLLVVAGLQWTAWHHRTLGDNTPNPYDWGGVGLCLFVAGVAAFSLRTRRSS